MNAILHVMGPGNLELFAAFEAEVLAGGSWTPYMIAEGLSFSVSRYWIATDESDNIVGYDGVEVSGDQADVITIGVRARAWGRGIGSTILNTLLKRSRETGVHEVFPDVHPSSKGAIGLYESRGLVGIGYRPHYFHSPAEEVIKMGTLPI